MTVPPETREVVQAWLKKAGNDLEAARRILAVRDECPFDTVCFHCQQAVEKALKAWMTLMGQPAPRVHDLEPLYAAVEETVSGLPPLSGILALNPYGVQVRYIDDWLDPSEQEALAALVAAEAVYDRIVESLQESAR